MSIERIEVLLLIGAIALLHVPVTLTLTKSLIFSAFLPPLIFEASLYIRGLIT